MQDGFYHTDLQFLWYPALLVHAFDVAKDALVLVCAIFILIYMSYAGTLNCLFDFRHCILWVTLFSSTGRVQWQRLRYDCHIEVHFNLHDRTSVIVVKQFGSILCTRFFFRLFYRWRAHRRPDMCVFSVRCRFLGASALRSVVVYFAVGCG